jgi:hypothetical protein
MAKRKIPVDLFYASDTGDCTYELNSRIKKAAGFQRNPAAHTAFY